MNNGLPAKLSVGLAILAFAMLIIAANWQFVNLAFSTHPGCVTIDTSQTAAKPGC